MSEWLITIEVLSSLASCFSGTDELNYFIASLEAISEEICFQAKMGGRMEEDMRSVVVMKVVCIITLFFRDNIELLNQLIKKIELQAIDKET